MGLESNKSCRSYERYAFLYDPLLEENNARADFLIKTDEDAAVVIKK